MIKITIEDTENKVESMTLTGEFGFAVVKIDRDKEDIIHTGSAAMGKINFMNMPRDIAAMGKETRNIIQNLDNDKVNSLFRILSFKRGFELKENDGV